MGLTEDSSIKAATRLAGLLADGRGAEVLAELQKLSGARWAADPGTSGRRAGAGGAPPVGAWAPEATGDGVALRRRQGVPEWWLWADVDQVPAPCGARRVALLGESAARGWLLDPVFNPAMALRRQLPGGPAGYQVVDLARTNIDLETLGEIAAALPVIEPQVVVVLAGNNFTFAPLDDRYRDELADALRRGGYPEMRATFVESVVLPRVDRFLDQLAGLRDEHGMQVVLVVPELNLRGWVAAAEVEVPALAAGAMEKWYRLRDDATAALDAGQWAQVRGLAAEMRSLDGGLSPVPGYLEGRASIAAGDGATARRLLEESRDAAAGLLLDLVPYVITPVRRRLLDFARAQDMPCVDMADALRSDDLPELPDPRFYLDHIHLTDEGIERVFCRVADAIAGRPPGTSVPGPGTGPTARALGHALGAGYCALHGQPAELVRYHLDRARAADPAAAEEFVTAFLDVLESPAIGWTHPALAALLANRQTYQLSLNVARARGHSPGFWTFREVASDLLGRSPRPAQDGWQTADLLRMPDARGFRAPNFVPGKAYFEATTRQSVFRLVLSAPRAGTLRLAYRLPAGDGDAAVLVNGVRAGRLPRAPGWSEAAVAVPATLTRTGINRMTIEWPLPSAGDTAVRDCDASALARRGFPAVLPVFGALFTAMFETAGEGNSGLADPGTGRGGNAPCRAAAPRAPVRQPPASRTDASTGWRPAAVPPRPVG